MACPGLFWGLPDEVWRHLMMMSRVEDSELIRLRRVCRPAHELIRSNPDLQKRVDAELERRASARREDKASRQWIYNVRRSSKASATAFRGIPEIVKRALEGDISGVEAELDAGADVDACGTWEEVEEKIWGEKSWTWNYDSALTMACSQGNSQLVELLLERGANPDHRVCNRVDEHYTGAKIARRHGHTACAERLEGVVRQREAAAREEYERKLHLQAAECRADALRLRGAGKPYPKALNPGTGMNRLTTPRELFYRAALFMREAVGGEADPEESAELLALCLAEFPTTLAAFNPSFKQALAQLQELASEGVATAAASAPGFEELLRAREEVERLEQERRQKEAAEWKRIYQEHRQKEVERCTRVHGDGAWQAACHGSCRSRSDRDNCTYGHSRREHDLPPLCMHGSKCYFGDRCRYNHIERVRADAKRAYNLIYPPCPTSSALKVPYGASTSSAAPRVPISGSSRSSAAPSGSLTYEVVMSMSREQAHEALKQLCPKPKYIAKMKRDDARKMLVERHGLNPAGQSRTHKDKCLDDEDDDDSVYVSDGLDYSNSDDDSYYGDNVYGSYF